MEAIKIFSSIRVLTILCIVALLPHPILAADFSMGIWQTTGSQSWTTSFPIDSKSKLYYPHAAVYTTLNYEKKLSPQKRVQVAAGLTTTFKQAKGSDADWDYTQSKEYWYYGKFQTNGTSGYITIDIMKEISKNRAFCWGYIYTVNHYRMTQGNYLIDDFHAVNSKYPNLASTYTMIYQGPHLGVTRQLPLTATLSLVSATFYSPLALVAGQGWWNLRDMKFSHLGTGQIFDTFLGAELKQSKEKALTIGYRYKYASLYHGGENISSTISWDKATFIQQGPFISGKIRF